MLPTISSNIPFRSPVGDGAQPPAAHDLREALDGGVALADLTGMEVIHLRTKREDHPALHWQSRRLQKRGALAEGGDFWSARLASDEYFLLFPSGVEGRREGIGSRTVPELSTATEVTHGIAIFLLVGARARGLLSKVCGLDLSDRAFPDSHVSQTSIARLPGTLIRRDWRASPAYLLVVGRSVGRYLWDTLEEAAQEFEAQVFDGEGYLSNA